MALFWKLHKPKETHNSFEAINEIRWLCATMCLYKPDFPTVIQVWFPSLYGGGLIKSRIPPPVWNKVRSRPIYIYIASLLLQFLQIIVIKYNHWKHEWSLTKLYFILTSSFQEIQGDVLLNEHFLSIFNSNTDTVINVLLLYRCMNSCLQMIIRCTKLQLMKYHLSALVQLHLCFPIFRSSLPYDICPFSSGQCWNCDYGVARSFGSSILHITSLLVVIPISCPKF